MSVLILTLVCALFYAGFAIFADLAGNGINSWLAAVLYNGIGTIIPLVVYLAVSSKGKTTTKGIVFASLAGICIMLFSVLLARIFSSGGTLGYVIPVIYGSVILLSSLFGWLVLKNKVNGLQIGGLVLLLAGILMIILSKSRVA